MPSILQFIRESEYPTSERQWQFIWLGITVSVLLLLSVSTGPDLGVAVWSLIGGTFVTALLGAFTAGLVAIQRYDAGRRAH